jgi:hypothetical protein
MAPRDSASRNDSQPDDEDGIMEKSQFNGSGQTGRNPDKLTLAGCLVYRSASTCLC